MCFLPCIGWSDVYVEEEPKKKKPKREQPQQPIVVFDPKANTWVELNGVKGTESIPTAAPMPLPQPLTSHPVHLPPINYQPYYQTQYTHPSNGYISQPAMHTYGHTATEVAAQQQAQSSEVNKKQEMKPVDDDPSRVYWVRELDSTWTQRNRLTIDSGDIGKCRWYAADGVFYAVRLEDEKK